MDGCSWQQWQNRIARLLGNDFEATLDLPVSCHWSTSRLESLRYLAVIEGWGAAGEKSSTAADFSGVHAG